MQKKSNSKHISNLSFYQLAEEKKLIIEKTSEKKPIKTEKKNEQNMSNLKNNRLTPLY